MLKQSRQCSHAGEWYPMTPNKLRHELSHFFHHVHKQHTYKKIKALIAPHQNLQVSGKTSAWAYQYITELTSLKTVFIFGPSHQKYFPGCALSSMDLCNTPFGELQVDTDIINKLKQNDCFHMLDIDNDQAEHSIQMHFPFIAHLFGTDVKVVPIMTGTIDDQQAEQYGRIFAPYFDDANTLFIFSTDFSHWGNKYAYTQYSKHDGQIWESIKKLDYEAMNLIESHQYKGFIKYIHKTHNTICGKHLLYIFLKIMQHSKLKLATKFVHYHQNELVKQIDQNTISFASAVTFQH